MITFVTGTDTGVGKTITVAALVARSHAADRTAYVIKPAQSGLTAQEPGDLAMIRHLVGGVAGYEGARLLEALAPDVAARREGAGLPVLAELAAHVRDASYDDVYVEGAGGVLVRVGANFTLLDLADVVGADRVQFVVVARAGLGTLNHTALTAEAIRARGHRVVGVVIGSLPSELDLAEETNLAEIEAYSGAPLLGTIPAGVDVMRPEDFAAQAPSWIRLPLSD